MEVLFLVLSQLAVGGALCMTDLGQDAGYRRYYATSTGVYFGAAICATAAAWTFSDGLPVGENLFLVFGGWTLAAIGLAFIASMVVRNFRGFRALYLLLGVIGLVVILSGATVGSEPRAGSDTLVVASFVSGTLLLGTAFNSMILAHFYLAYHGLGMKPAVIATSLFGLAVILRAALVAPAVASYWSAESFEAQAAVHALLFGSEALFFWVRVGLGLAIPAVLALLTLGCWKVRSNTSATGIMYAASVLVLVGELTSRYLLVLRGVPV